MLQAIPEYRKQVSKYALKVVSFNIDKDKIRDVIGSQGKVINSIIAECGDLKIDINDDGKVILYSVDQANIDKAKSMIDDIVRVPEVNQVYSGLVTRVEQYGAFVKLYGNVEGLCHISKLGWNRVEKVEDVCKVGDTLDVKIIGISDKGIDLSHRDLLEKPADYVEPKPFDKSKKFDKKPYKPNNKGSK